MATNRLRKRLDEADERTKARVNESFCTVGTPLPSLDSSKRDANEYKPEWQQEVYDDQGRRRFHGAFTGGFSAGYYNTVGSKEGWAPSSFRSSRKEKQKAGKDGGQTASASRNVQDFMDEEDLEDVRQGRGALQSSEAYGGKPREAPIERDPLLGMLGLAQPADSGAAAASSSHAITGKTSDSIGTKMLRQMGWKPGHGLGPLVSAKRRRELAAALGGVEATVDESDSNRLVAPPDTQLVKPPLRQGSRGLGWDGSDRPATLAEALQRERGTQATSNGPRRSGFGIGALEQDSDGEEEVYSVGHRIEQSTLQAGRRKAKSDAKEQRKTPQTKESLSDDKENKWQDGRPMLAGFRIAQRPLTQERWYAAPRPPAGWKPDPQRVWTQAAVATAATKSGAIEVNLGPSQRASILGEARIPGPPPMITDYLSLKARERVERSKAAAGSDAASAPGAAVVEPISAVQRTIPKLDSATAEAALVGYMPFETELAKQRRYKDYLRSQVEPQLSMQLSPDEGQSVEQFHRELNEFSRSAAIFKPMSTVMASRFESSASGSTHVQPLAPGLYIPDQNAQLEREATSKMADTKSADEERVQSEWQGLTAVRRNARMGLFGPDTTREVKSWKPARLLCKRFNVAPPYSMDEEENEETAETAARPADEDQVAFGASFDKRSGGSVVSGGVNARWEASKRQLQHLAASRAWEGHDVDVQRVDEKPVAETKTTGTSNALANVGFGCDDEVREEMTYVKPPLDLFKAIFADDDVESEQHNGTAAPSAEAVVRQASSPPAEAIRNASHAALPRPTFIPRKRPIVDSVDANTGGERTPGHQTKKAKAKDGRNASKTKRRSLLTFDIDNDDDVDDDITFHKRSQQQVDTPSDIPRRPRASDLFD